MTNVRLKDWRQMLADAEPDFEEKRAQQEAEVRSNPRQPGKSLTITWCPWCGVYQPSRSHARGQSMMTFGGVPCYGTPVSLRYELADPTDHSPRSADSLPG